MALSPEENQELILASFRGDIPVADLCRRVQIPESTFRDWRDRFLAASETTRTTHVFLKKSRILAISSITVKRVDNPWV